MLKVFILRKALYNLKQSPYVWVERFRYAMICYGYRQTQPDRTQFIKCQGLKITTLIVYVDDIVFIENDEVEMVNPNGYLEKEFKIKDLSTLKYFLKIEVVISKQGIFLSERKYVLNLLKNSGIEGCKPC